MTVTVALPGFSPGPILATQSDADLAGDLASMGAIGADVVRAEVKWASIEGTHGVYKWAATDRIVNAVLAHGMQPLLLISSTPAWARPGTDPLNGWNRPPVNPADFGTFCAAAASHYAPMGVHLYEIWNEPNLAQFLTPCDPVIYTSLLAAAYPAVHAADPAAFVLSGGLAAGQDGPYSEHMVRFLVDMYAAGAGGQMDGVAVHPYGYPDLPMSVTAGNFFWIVPSVHNLMAAMGDGAKPVWVTEYGAPTGTFARGVTEAQQAQAVADAYHQAPLWPWLGGLLWYAYRDKAVSATDRESNFGIVRYDGTPKAAWAAYQAANS